MGCTQSQDKPFRCENKNCRHARILQALAEEQASLPPDAQRPTYNPAAALQIANRRPPSGSCDSYSDSIFQRDYTTKNRITFKADTVNKNVLYLEDSYHKIQANTDDINKTRDARDLDVHKISDVTNAEIRSSDDVTSGKIYDIDVINVDIDDESDDVGIHFSSDAIDMNARLSSIRSEDIKYIFRQENDKLPQEIYIANDNDVTDKSSDLLNDDSVVLFGEDNAKYRKAKAVCEICALLTDKVSDKKLAETTKPHRLVKDRLDMRSCDTNGSRISSLSEEGSIKCRCREEIARLQSNDSGHGHSDSDLNSSHSQISEYRMSDSQEELHNVINHGRGNSPYGELHSDVNHDRGRSPNCEHPDINHGRCRSSDNKLHNINNSRTCSSNCELHNINHTRSLLPEYEIQSHMDPDRCFSLDSGREIKADTALTENGDCARRVRRLSMSIPFSFPIIKEIEIEPKPKSESNNNLNGTKRTRKLSIPFAFQIPAIKDKTPDGSKRNSRELDTKVVSIKPFQKSFSFSGKEKQDKQSMPTSLVRFFTRRASMPTKSISLDAGQLQNLQQMALESRQDATEVISEESEEEVTQERPTRRVSVPSIQHVLTNKNNVPMKSNENAFNSKTNSQSLPEKSITKLQSSRRRNSLPVISLNDEVQTASDKTRRVKHNSRLRKVKRRIKSPFELSPGYSKRDGKPQQNNNLTMHTYPQNNGLPMNTYPQNNGLPMNTCPQNNGLPMNTYPQNNGLPKNTYPQNNGLPKNTYPQNNGLPIQIYPEADRTKIPKQKRFQNARNNIFTNNSVILALEYSSVESMVTDVTHIYDDME